MFFLLDEFATMRFPDIAITVSNIRKFQAGLLLCVQDEQTLIAQYGPHEAHQIKTNCACQVYLRGQPPHTCKELSQIFGRYSMVDEQGKERGARELMTSDEIRMCNDVIILIQNNPSLRCQPVPYYENFWLTHLAKRPPLALPERTVVNPPTLPFAS